VGLENPLHLMIILMVVLLVFGAKRLPEMGRSLGSGMRGFKEAISGELTTDHPAVTDHPAATGYPAVVDHAAATGYPAVVDHAAATDHPAVTAITQAEPASDHVTPSV
jgi:sec-independent protein translocase protein TatA